MPLAVVSVECATAVGRFEVTTRYLEAPQMPKDEEGQKAVEALGVIQLAVLCPICSGFGVRRSLRASTRS